MKIIPKIDAIAHAAMAERGNFTAIATLFRSLINGGLNSQMLLEAGPGILAGAGVTYRSSVQKVGGIIESKILVDLEGLSSATSDLDVIGLGTGSAFIARMNAARNGTPLAGRMECLELPASLTDIDLYASPELNAFEDLITSDTGETALVTKGGAWAAGAVNAFTALPGVDDYLYLVNGAADTADPFTAGKFLITLYGYDPNNL